MIKVPRFLIEWISWRSILVAFLVALIFGVIKEIVLPPTIGTPSQVLERFYKDMSNSYQMDSGYFSDEVSPETKVALSVFDPSVYCGYDKKGNKICAGQFKILALNILIEKSDNTSATALVEAILIPYATDYYYFSNEFPRKSPTSQRVDIRLEKDNWGRDSWKILQVTDTVPMYTNYDVKFLVSGDTTSKVEFNSYLDSSPSGVAPKGKEVSVPWQASFSVERGQRLSFSVTRKAGPNITCEIIVNGKSFVRESTQTYPGYDSIECTGYAIGEHGSLEIPLH